MSFAPLCKYKEIVSSPQLHSELNGFAPGLTRAPAPCHTRAADVSYQKEVKLPKITTKEIGDSAENVAAIYLQKHGHKILDRNWKTKSCEIDIVSKKNSTIYFTEVKYRKNANQGGGIDAITNKKLKQMSFSAGYYSLVNKLDDKDLHLAVITVEGNPPTITDFIEI